MECCIRTKDGKLCELLATHHWGGVKFCCAHFDVFLEGMLELKDAVQFRLHDDFVSEYVRRTHRQHRIEGTVCEAEKKEKP